MNPVLRCKMRVQQVKQYIVDDKVLQEDVRLEAVTATTEENAQWSKYTPAASFNIVINNPPAFNKLPEGHEFYVDFTPAE